MGWEFLFAFEPAPSGDQKRIEIIALVGWWGYLSGGAGTARRLSLGGGPSALPPGKGLLWFDLMYVLKLMYVRPLRSGSVRRRDPKILFYIFTVVSVLLFWV